MGVWMYSPLSHTSEGGDEYRAVEEWRCHFVHYRFYMESFRIEPEPLYRKDNTSLSELWYSDTNPKSCAAGFADLTNEGLGLGYPYW